MPYFIKKVADWQTIWSLGNAKGWVLGRDEDGHETVVVSPNEAFAKACAEGPLVRV
jgi:hypothetical protein